MRTTYEFEESDFQPLAGVAEAMRNFGKSCEGLARGLRRFAVAAQGAATLDESPYWAIYPGEWPDNFTLLNRYLRTGVKPPFLFNE